MAGIIREGRQMLPSPPSAPEPAGLPQLTLVEGSSGTRIQDNETTAEAFFGVRSRVDWRLTIDTASGSDKGLYTAAVSFSLLQHQRLHAHLHGSHWTGGLGDETKT